MCVDGGDEVNMETGMETSGEDFAAKAAARFGDAVESLQGKTVKPLFWVARMIVYGLVVAALGAVVGVLLLDLLVRMLDVYAFGGRVWITDFVLGGLFVIAGAFLWLRMRRYSFQTPGK